ncbi:MAG: NAD(P)/FAD-dependent oxidoreductase [Capsulimonadaceae bacterium]|nr:NAD(P)/FAD-dependent oxidoreductase [Capsulimonadaceae bacterium]
MNNIEINPEEIYDVTIIGAGPVGQYAAYYAGLRQMRTKVIDSLPELGGQLTALYPEKYIYDVAGFPKVYARDLVASLTEQMMQYNPVVLLDIKILTLDIQGDVAILTTDQGERHFTRSVVITAGVGAFAPRKPSIEGIERFEGKGIHYAVRNKSALAGRRLMIAGGGDSAFDWALNLADTAAGITLVHRSDRFRAHEDSVIKVLEGGFCDVRTFHEITAIHGNGALKAVTTVDNRTKEEVTHDVDDLLITMGFISDLGPIKNWGLDIQGNSIVVNSKMETNIPRVYGAGDVITYPGKLKLISTGFGDAATAVNHAKSIIDPSAKVFPGHSSG